MMKIFRGLRENREYTDNSNGDQQTKDFTRQQYERQMKEEKALGIHRDKRSENLTNDFSKYKGEILNIMEKMKNLHEQKMKEYEKRYEKIKKEYPDLFEKDNSESSKEPKLITNMTRKYRRGKIMSFIGRRGRNKSEIKVREAINKMLNIYDSICDCIYGINEIKNTIQKINSEQALRTSDKACPTSLGDRGNVSPRSAFQTGSEKFPKFNQDPGFEKLLELERKLWEKRGRLLEMRDRETHGTKLRTQEYNKLNNQIYHIERAMNMIEKEKKFIYEDKGVYNIKDKSVKNESGQEKISNEKRTKQLKEQYYKNMVNNIQKKINSIKNDNLEREKIVEQQTGNKLEAKEHGGNKGYFFEAGGIDGVKTLKTFSEAWKKKHNEGANKIPSEAVENLVKALPRNQRARKYACQTLKNLEEQGLKVAWKPFKYWIQELDREPSKDASSASQNLESALVRYENVKQKLQNYQVHNTFT